MSSVIAVNRQRGNNETDLCETTWCSSPLFVYHCYEWYTVSVLGLDKGYTVKYNPLSEGNLEGKGLNLAVYPESSPHTDSIYSLWIPRNYFCLVIQSNTRVILDELILSNPLPERPIFHRIFPRGYMPQYPRANTKCLCTGKYTWLRGQYLKGWCPIYHF